MGDMGDIFRENKEFVKERKTKRAAENMSYLEEHGIEWEWIDEGCDHILIGGRIDYYLGKTYYFDRKEKKSGYAMLRKLLKERIS